MAGSNRRSVDPAVCEMLEITDRNGEKVVFDRFEAMQPQCGFGQLGICCRNCAMGPCRIDPFGEGPQQGICGATADVIAARNLVRGTAVGASAHSDHGRDITHAFLATARGEAQGYSIKGITKLKALAQELGVEVDGASPEEIAEKVAEATLKEFGRQEGELRFAKRAPEKVQARWKEMGVTPRGVDREVVTALHRTHIGVSNEWKHLIKTCVQTSLSDGWGGSMIATDLSDILFGEPMPRTSQANLGVLRQGEVNIIIHGHEPTLSDAIVAAAQLDEVQAEVDKVGAKGLNLGGMCCTANEALMRHGIPLVGNFLQQEFALVTGAVEMMIVDVQCIMPALSRLVDGKYHTKLLSTSPNAMFEGFEHIQFDENKAMDSAKELLLTGIRNFANRDPAKVHIPDEKSPLVAGFTAESVFDHLGGRYRPSYRPLNNGIIDGRLRGVAGVVGCNNVKITHDWAHLELVKELLRHDVLVVLTGCSAIACAKAGLLAPEAVDLYAGRGLKEICDAVGLPPCLHVGSCVDNSRILMACTEMVREGGLGEDIADLPVAGAAPEWMSEKAISIAFYVVTSGIFTVIGEPLPVLGSKKVTEYLTDGMEEDYGGKFAFEKDPMKAAHLIIDHLNSKREALHLAPMMFEPRPADMVGQPWDFEASVAAAK